MTPTTSRRPLRALVTAAATAVIAGGGLFVASVPAQAASNSCPPPSANPPTANTWYDANGLVRGTRIVSQEQYRAIQRTVVYETVGPDYHQTETWDLRIIGDPMRLQCERKQHNPNPKPSEPIIINGGGGGGADGGAYFRPVGGYHSFSSGGPTGTVTVGTPEPLPTGKVTVGPVTNAQ